MSNERHPSDSMTLSLGRQLLKKALALPLAVKAACLAALISWTACAILLAAGHQGNQQNLKDVTDLLGEELSSWLADEAASTLVRGDHLQLQSALSRYLENPLIGHIVVTDLEQRPLAEAGTSQQGQWSYTENILFQKTELGELTVSLQSEQIVTRAKALNQQLLILATLLSVLAYTLAYRPARWVSRELEQLANWVQADKEWPENYRGEDELQSLKQQLKKVEVIRAAVEKEPQQQAQVTTVLTIQTPELPKYRQRLDEARFLQCYRHWLNLIERVAHLQGAEVTTENSTAISLSFSGRNGPLNAMRCAWLLHRLRQEGGLPICGSIQLLKVQECDSKLSALAVRDAIASALKQASKLLDEEIGLTKAIADLPGLDDYFDLSESGETYRLIAPHDHHREELERVVAALDLNPPPNH